MSQAISQTSRAPLRPEVIAQAAIPALSLTERRVGDMRQQTVSARDLHGYMEVRRDFSTWITDRIAEFGFAEDVDFARHLLPNFGEKGRGRSKHEYALTLDMAKELAMVERNDRGRAARRYFIACEKRLLDQHSMPASPEALLNDPVALRALLLRTTDGLLAARRELAEVAAKDKAEAVPLYRLDEVALRMGTEPHRLWQIMASLGWVSRGRAREGRMPSMQLATEAGLQSGAIRMVSLENQIVVAVTPAGLSRLLQARGSAG